MSREQAYDLLKEVLSNYISLLGIGLAIIAVLFAVIQLAYKRLSIVEITLENTFFAPLFYFGTINSAFCGLLILFNPSCDDHCLVSDYFFIRFIVIENYLFVGFVGLLCLVFYKTVTFTNFAKINEAYLKNILKRLKSEQNARLDSQHKESLQEYSYELNAEVTNGIADNRLVTVVKIIDVYTQALGINPNSTLLIDYKWRLADWLHLAYKSENDDLFGAIIENWRNQFSMLVGSNSENIGTVFNLPVILYNKSTTNADLKFRQHVIQSFPIRLKELALMAIWESTDDTAIINEAKFSSVEIMIKEFNDLIKVICDQLDDKGLVETLQNLKQVKDVHRVNDRYRDLKFNQRLHNDVQGADRTQMEKFQNFYLLIFAVEFGNLCWLYFRLFNYDKDYNRFKQTIEALERYTSCDRETLIEYTTKIFYWERQLGWNRWIWNSEERLDGEVYFLENETTFLALGFIIKLMRSGFEEFDLSDEMIERTEGLVHICKEVIKRYQGEKEIWMVLLGLGTSQQVDDILSRTVDVLNGLSIKRDKIKQTQLIAEPLSKDKVQEFRTAIELQWNQSRIVAKIFEYFNAQLINPEQKLKIIGMMRINFKGGRTMFVESGYQKVHGIEWGHKVNDAVSEHLIETVCTGKDVATINARNAEEAIEAIFSHDKHINIVFISYGIWYKLSNVLLSSGNFVQGEHMQVKYPFPAAGIYKDRLIIVPLSRVRLLADTLVGISLPNSIKLLRRENHEWVQDKLQVDIFEIDQAEASSIIKDNNPTADENDPELINEVMSGIMIEINETLDFEIEDAKKMAVVKLPTSR
ncbi:MAG: hypothetical protein EOP56_02790 [Sphingobacteriales bacterium]|nr:MAG: hypothetical protein EOP56_02790 [Sphingobacteriales bacterium]